jgi:hypothetical protein
MLRGSLANLQSKLENLELKAEIRALKDNAAQQANYQVYPLFPVISFMIKRFKINLIFIQALETKFAKQIEQLEVNFLLRLN